jgi:hypothetical protein
VQGVEDEVLALKEALNFEPKPATSMFGKRFLLGLAKCCKNLQKEHGKLEQLLRPICSQRRLNLTTDFRQRRRRDIFVETRRTNLQAPSGAISSECSAPNGALLFCV